MNSLIENVPANARKLTILQLEIVAEVEIGKDSYIDKKIYDLLSIFEKRGEIVEVRFSYLADDRKRGDAFFLSVHDGAPRILIPDVQFLWGLDKLRDRAVENGRE